MTPPAAIVLAAGEGRRMGGPKALLLVDGKPLIAAHTQRLRELGCSPILVVTRPGAAQELAGVRVITASTGSMAASLTAAVCSLAPVRERIVIVAPIDSLPVGSATLRALLTAATTDGVRVATPCYRGQSGHPIAISEELLQVFRQGYTGTLRDLVRSAGAQRRRVAVDDPRVVVDLDTPADLAALRPGLLPRFAAVASTG